MKRRAVTALALCGAVFTALLFFACSNAAPRPFLPLEPLSLSRPDGGNDCVSQPEIVLREEALPSDALLLSAGSEAEGHDHAFHLISYKEASCAADGQRLYRCECGRETKETIPALPHTPSFATCTEASVCTLCGTVLDLPLGHDFPAGSDLCSRCGFTLTASFYVLDQTLEFDDPADGVRAKLGDPTAVITEGDLFTYVYAADLRRLTFVQMDEGGVWGVYSFDPALRMRYQGKSFGLSDFAGQRPEGADEEWIAFGDVTAFVFRDRGAAYALWMRLDEYEYNFATEPNVRDDYAGQEKISLYIANALRTRAGLQTLIRSPQADQVAREYCDAMIATDSFAHDMSFEWRLREKGIVWREAGENLSRGYINAFFVLDAYLNSPEHRENLLKPVYTHVGLSYRRSGWIVFGAQEFYS